MRRIAMVIIWLACTATLLTAQENAGGPTDNRAQKTYKEGQEFLKKGRVLQALESFKKADKQDGGHCLACQKNMVRYGLEAMEWKDAETGAEEMVAEAKDDRSAAIAYFELGSVFLREGVTRHKDDLIGRAHEQFTQALAKVPTFPDAVMADGLALARLKQDDAAKARFEQFVKMKPPESPDRQRALRYINQPELARARMAPAFAVTTLDGRRLTLDDLQGKVVLLDFWATWCGPCREALPHMRKIAKSFEGQPLVVLSVSLDGDEQKWKDFIEKNGMTWLHYRDGGFEGRISKLFGIEAIPHTFTIDADGVLQDEHIGDASIEGKLKKLVARARELQPPEKAAQ